MVLGAVSGEMISCKYCAPPPSYILHPAPRNSAQHHHIPEDGGHGDTGPEHIQTRVSSDGQDDRRAGDYEVQTK